MFSIKKVLANVAQSLTDAEKLQARQNIGVSDTGDAFVYTTSVQEMSNKTIDNTWRKAGIITVGKTLWSVPPGVLRLKTNWTQLIEWKVAGLTPNDMLRVAIVPGTGASARMHSVLDTQVTIDGKTAYSTGVFAPSTLPATIPINPYCIHDFTVTGTSVSISFDVYLKFDTNGSSMTLPGTTSSGTEYGEIEMMNLLRKVLDNNLPTNLPNYVGVGVYAENVK